MRKLQLLKYIALIRDEMGLSEWTFEISSAPLSFDYSICEVEPTFRRAHAVFGFSKDFHKSTLEEIRYLICHEWAHIFLAQLDDSIKSNLKKITTDEKEIALVMESVDNCVEYAVDRIAKAFARKSPLP